ncbi:MAG: Trp biosynthesis-associated membrane protein [Janthinobacterium lividum]
MSAVAGPVAPASTSAPSGRTGRLRGLALGGLAVGAVLALVSGSRAWWRAAGTGVSVAFTGTETTGGLAQALALVVLAGALLGLVLRSRGRRVLGVLLVLAGAGVLVLGLTRPRPAAGTVQSRVLEVSLADQFALLGTAWPYAYAAAGLVVLAAAGLMALTAARWPSRAARFERPPAGQPARSEQPVPSGADADADGQREEDPASLWRLQDAGVDPTAAGDGDPNGGASSERADVHEQPLGVTMKPPVPSGTDEPT